jgi:PAS domain S-box-containing protein
VTFDVSARKRAEEERDRAIQRWSTTLTSIGDGVVTTDPAGNIDFLNPVAEAYMKRSLDEVRGRPLTQVFTIVNEETRERVENPVERVLREGSIVGLANHTVLVRPDGTDLPIDDSAAPIRAAAGELHGVVLVFRDVSAQKREQARREFLARAGEALVATNDYRDSLAVVARLAVPRLADWCGVDILEPGAHAPEQLAVAHVDPAKIEYARELGRRYPPDPNATTGVPQVIRTGKPELYPQIPPQMIEAAVIDDEHRRILQELKLRSAMVVPLRGRSRVFGAMTFVYADSGRLYDEDDLAFAEQLAERAGLVIERRKLEEERTVLLGRERAARQDAEEANRAKDEFLATVSHELRTPLNAILGWSSILRRKDVPEDIERALTVIERNARAQARLIEDLLDMSRILSGKLRLEVRPTDVALAIADAIEAVRLAADAKGIALESRVDDEVGTILADPDRLQQIVWNLLSNAVKFTPKGGHVSLSASRDPSRVTIVVQDDGKGMPPELLPGVFEPFRQADASATRRFAGLGLGLSIVRQLVQAHGGSIRAESGGEGRGATFTVELPVRAPALTREGGERSVERERVPVRLDGLRVLLVEDEPDALDLIRESLAGFGAHVETATSAEEGFEKLRATRPDVLVSDIGMPGEDGLSLMRRVRSLPTTHGGRTQALALTAYASEDDALRAFAAGFQLHVSKPVDPDELGAAIARLAQAASTRSQ